jgi:hypothetical protein
MTKLAGIWLVESEEWVKKCAGLKKVVVAEFEI